MAKWKSSDTTIKQPVAVKNMDPRVVPGPPDFADDDAVGRLKVSFQSQADFLAGSRPTAMVEPTSTTNTRCLTSLATVAVSMDERRFTA